MAHLVLFLLAACSPATSAPEPEPVEEPEPTPEPQPDIAELHTVAMSFGKACEDPAEGEPVDAAQVEARLKKAGIDYVTVEPAAACTACGTCPRFAVEIETTWETAKVKAALRPMPKVPKDGKLTLDVGRKCSQPIDGAPATAEEVIAALEEDGIKVVSHETRMACAACGCPEIALSVQVDPADAKKAMQLAQPWTPPAETGDSLPSEDKDKPKGSLP